MRKYSVFGIRSSVFALMITGYWILNTLALPTPSLAAIPPGCIVNTGGCSSGGIQCPNNAGYCCPDANACNNLIVPSTGVLPLCGTDNLGVNTAIGCLMAGDPKQLVSQLLGWGVGVGGGIAFLMIIFAGFQMATASGDPKRVKAAQELLTSALAGLILIVFSLALLKLIGINILGLGTLGFPAP